MKALLGIDKGAAADVLFLKHVCGEGGTSALQASFQRKCLPLQDGSRSIADAVKGAPGADTIVKSDLFGALTTEKQAQMKSAVALAKYFKHEGKGASSDSASTATVTVYGKEAMHAYITSLKQKGKIAIADNS
eukprot:4131018-Amphidinium_carterae.1